jgi:hypothetical protein
MTEPTATYAVAGPRRSSQTVGNIGLYFACYRLSQLGWNVMPTARNARGVDIIAYNHDASVYIGVQVKALSKRDPVPLGSTLDKIMGDWWVIVTSARTSPVPYVLRPDEVRDGHFRSKGEPYTHWLQPPAYDRPEFKEAWGRIGRGDTA